MKSVYIETSVPSYLTARPSRDLRIAAWQQITAQWWDEERKKYKLFVSELVRVEAAAGDPHAAQRRLSALDEISELYLTNEANELALRLMADDGIPANAKADAIHIAIATVHEIDYLLTWNCRHIDNAVRKPIVRSICAVAGYVCPEICTPLELLAEERNHVL